MLTKYERDQAADAATKGAIARAIEAYSLSDAEMARAAGIAPRTWSERKRHPGSFSLAEIRRLYPVARWTDEEILGMIRGRT